MPNVMHFVEAAPSVRVLVAGDCMLDAYITGAASRISPEAPVPIVDVARRSYVPGGAANVAANIRSLGSCVVLAGVTGIDESGIRLRRELDQNRVFMDALVEDASRVTTTKTRVTVAGHQIVRFDDEDRSVLPEEVLANLMNRCSEVLDRVDVCVISDYAKGVASDRFCRWLVAETTRRKLPLVVDPKSADFSKYRGATLITPNLKETAAAAGEALRTREELNQAAERLLAAISPSALLVTRGEDGMSLFQKQYPERHLPALVNEVADVTGAGDTVVATLAIALGMRLSLFEAAELANIAAGVAVSHNGTWAVKANELLTGARLSEKARV